MTLGRLAAMGADRRPHATVVPWSTVREGASMIGGLMDVGLAAIREAQEAGPQSGGSRRVRSRSA
jgi:hypothetical protein